MSSRTERTRRWVYALHALILLIGAIALLNWDRTSQFIKDYETFFKLAGYIVAPSLAYLGFIRARLDKSEMADLTTRLTHTKRNAREESRKSQSAKAEAEVARREADEATLRARNAEMEATKRSLEAQEAATNADIKDQRIRALQEDLETIANSTQIWRLAYGRRATSGFAQFNTWKDDPSGAKIVTVGLFKGGVGKTHVAANLAAYVAERQKQPVLLVDLDYQGSLSTALLTAAQIEARGSVVNLLFDADVKPERLDELRVSLGQLGPGGVLNGTKGLPHVSLIPADYELNRIESKLLVERAIQDSPVLDERFRLANVLLDPLVRRKYGLIIIDTPPRMTLGTVNALVASHALVVPTILDRYSTEAVVPFLKQVQAMRNELWLDSLTVAGLVGTMTVRKSGLNDREIEFATKCIETLQTEVPELRVAFTAKSLPRKEAVLTTDDLGYFLKDDGGRLSSQIYDPIFDELWARIHEPSPERPNRVRLFY